LLASDHNARDEILIRNPRIHRPKASDIMAAAAACAAAASLRPDLPVVAFLLEHNRGSKAAAERAGLQLAWRGPDSGNPDATAVRLIYADRPLADDVIKTLTRCQRPLRNERAVLRLRWPLPATQLS
jgi:hypothetical protein